MNTRELDEAVARTFLNFELAGDDPWRAHDDMRVVWHVVQLLDVEDGRWLSLARHRDGWRAVLSSTRNLAPLHVIAEALTAEVAVLHAALRCRGVDVEAETAVE